MFFSAELAVVIRQILLQRSPGGKLVSRLSSLCKNAPLGRYSPLYFFSEIAVLVRQALLQRSHGGKLASD